MQERRVKSVISCLQLLIKPRDNLRHKSNFSRLSWNIEKHRLYSKEKSFNMLLMKLISTNRGYRKPTLKVSASESPWKIRCAMLYSACSRIHNFNRVRLCRLPLCPLEQAVYQLAELWAKVKVSALMEGLSLKQCVSNYSHTKANLMRKIMSCRWELKSFRNSKELISLWVSRIRSFRINLAIYSTKTCQLLLEVAPSPLHNSSTLTSMRVAVVKEVHSTVTWVGHSLSKWCTIINWEDQGVE